MKTWRLSALLVIGLLLFTALPDQAAADGFHGRGGGRFHGGHGDFSATASTVEVPGSSSASAPCGQRRGGTPRRPFTPMRRHP